MRNQKWSRRDVLKTATRACGGSLVRRAVTGGRCPVHVTPPYSSWCDRLHIGPPHKIVSFRSLRHPAHWFAVASGPRSYLMEIATALAQQVASAANMVALL